MADTPVARTARNRLGVWALLCSSAGLFLLMMSALPVIVAIGTLLSAGSVVLGFRGRQAVELGQADNRAMNIVAILLGVLGVLLWLLAIVGMTMDLA